MTNETPPENTEQPCLYPEVGSVVEQEDHLPTIIESMCMRCEKNGETRLLLTKIPFFREVILMSFACPHCGEKSTTIQPGGAVMEKGVKYTLVCKTKEDLDRHIVKSDSATFRLKELEFEIPPGIGVMTNIEGLLSTALDQLKDSQAERRQYEGDETIEKLNKFITRLSLCLTGYSFPFTIELDDPAGNSHVQNPNAPSPDPLLKVEKYQRTKQQIADLRLQDGNDESQDQTTENQQPVFGTDGGDTPGYKKDGGLLAHVRGDNIDPTMVEKEVLSIPSHCPNCAAAGFSRMFVTDIPFFKEIILMAFNCTKCGFKSNEIKGGGEIPPHGQRETLTVKKKDFNERLYAMNMNRDVIKSNTAGVEIPELDLLVTHGSLGGMYTTVEGLLDKVKSTLFDGQITDYEYNDCIIDKTKRSKMQIFEERFEQCVRGEIDFTIIIEDPLANSYIYNPYAPEPDEHLKSEKFTRTYEHDEELGLNDINVDATVSTQYTDVTQAEQNEDGVVQQKEGLAQQHMQNLQKYGQETHPNRDVVAQPESMRDLS